MLRAGLTLAVGDDAAPLGTLDMIRMLNLMMGCARDATLNPRFMRAERAVEIGTINGARARGLEKEVGSIEIGKKADIIILNTKRLDWGPIHNIVKNLIWSATGDSVETVIIDGKIVMEENVIKTLNELELIDKIQEINDELIPKVKEKVHAVHRINKSFPIVYSRKCVYFLVTKILAVFLMFFGSMRY